MFTKEQLSALMCAKGRDGILAAVSQVPQEDLQTALAMVVSLYQHSVETESKVWEQEHSRCLELEKELQMLNASMMNRRRFMLRKVEKNNIICAIVEDSAMVITDVQSALDLLMTAKYEIGTKNIVISKERIAEDFFVLSTRLAGEILQKYINYGGRIAIYGDFSHYTSKPLKDFIFESNKGKDVFFVATEEDAVERLTR